MLLGLALQRDVDDHGNRGFGIGRIDQSGIAADHTSFFHQLDTPQTCRRRQADFRGNGRIAHAGINPQKPQDITVNGIQGGHGIFLN
jgi:hypothetical protein